MEIKQKTADLRAAVSFMETFGQEKDYPECPSIPGLLTEETDWGKVRIIDCEIS